MPALKWRKRPTRYFGDTWVPIAHLALRASDGRVKQFTLQVDSGAVISLLRRSSATSLGLELEAGRRVELAAVGGAETVAFVHNVRTRFDDSLELNVPFAIAASEDVPHLLGRAGVFDQLQIDFDSTLKGTRIAARWLPGTSVPGS